MNENRMQGLAIESKASPNNEKKLKKLQGAENQQSQLHWSKHSLMNMDVIDDNINDKGKMTSGKNDGMNKIYHMV